MKRHEEDWDAQDTYWADRGGYYSGLEGRAKSAHAHDLGSPAHYVFSIAWERGNARRKEEDEDVVMPPFSFKSNVKLVAGVSAAVLGYLGFIYLVFEVLT